MKEADDPTSVICEHGILEKDKRCHYCLYIPIIGGFFAYFYLLVWAYHTNMQVEYMLNPPRLDCGSWFENHNNDNTAKILANFELNDNLLHFENGFWDNVSSSGTLNEKIQKNGYLGCFCK
jgi:hypothetical protein